MENGYIESFNGKLRDKCLNVEVFFSLADARRKLEHWHRDYNHQRPHSALADRTPTGCTGDKAALDNAARLPLSRRSAATEQMLKQAKSSSQLLETVI